MTSTHRPISEDDLTAYLDGELSEERRALVEAWLARNSAAAERLAHDRAVAERLRGNVEKLSGGGTSSGLMSFLEVFDRAAGATKSGGTTRRGAALRLQR